LAIGNFRDLFAGDCLEPPHPSSPSTDSGSQAFSPGVEKGAGFIYVIGRFDKPWLRFTALSHGTTEFPDGLLRLLLVTDSLAVIQKQVIFPWFTLAATTRRFQRELQTQLLSLLSIAPVRLPTAFGQGCSCWLTGSLGKTGKSVLAPLALSIRLHVVKVLDGVVAFQLIRRMRFWADGRIRC